MARLIQQRFTQGELDPKMLGRTDIDQYYGAAEKMTNVIALPQGGFKRRGGLEHLNKTLRQISFLASPTISAPNGGTTSNANDRSAATSLTTTANISTTNPYVVVQYDFGSAKSLAVVYLFGLALTAGTSSEFYIQGSSDASSWTNVGTALTLTTTATNYSRRVQNTYRYIRLVRIGSTDLGTAKVTLTDMNAHESGSLSNYRIIDFQFNTNQVYSILATDKNLAVHLDGVLQIDIYAENLTSARLPQINWTQSADTLIIFHEDVETVRVRRNGADDNWLLDAVPFESVPFHAFTETEQTGSALGLGTLTPSAVDGTVKLTLSAGAWPAGRENQYIEGNGGRARILSLVSSSVVNAAVEIPFYNTDAIANTDWSYFSGYEETWSASRGWPISGSFHEGRLWIGGSKARPTTAWASRVGLYFDFSLGAALDDDGIELTLDTDQLNRFTNVYSGRNLMFFTTGGEFIIPQQLSEPITPGNVSTAKQSRVGSETGFRVFDVEGGIFYIQSGGLSIQEFIFSDTQQAYVNNLLSLLSGHLVSQPTDYTVRRATSLDDGALLVLTRQDGNATIATIQRSQNITAFTDHSTDGEFKACGVDYNEIYFVVERTINGTTDGYYERLTEEHLLDASTRFAAGLPTDTFTGLYQLEAKSCRVVADDAVLPSVTPSSGSATISRDATDYCEIGLWFQPYFKDLPTEIRSQNLPTTMGRLLNLAEVVLRLYNTRSVKVNNKRILFRGFGPASGGSPLDTPPPLFSGIKRLLGFRGWDYTAQVEITQEEPASLTVLAMSKRVEIGG